LYERTGPMLKIYALKRDCSLWRLKKNKDLANSSA
jgi:hypothetical protein